MTKDSQISIVPKVMEVWRREGVVREGRIWRVEARIRRGGRSWGDDFIRISGRAGGGLLV